MNKKLLDKAVKDKIITELQAEQLYKLFKENSIWNISNLFIYFGGLSAIGSVTYFITIGFAQFGYMGLIISSLVFLGLAILFIKNTQNKVAIGVLATFVVFLTPLFMYGILGYVGWWDSVKSINYHNYYIWIDKNWIILEISTIIAALFMLKKVKYPFLILPIAFSLWFLSMDIVELIFGKLTWHNREIISIIFGIITTIIAFFVDLKNKDYAFWLYIFGVMMFWSGMSLLNSNSEVSKFIYFLINVFLLVIGTLIKRKVFLVFGSLGIIGYFGHLSYIFKGSFLFPILLALFGFIVIAGGIKYKEYDVQIRTKILSFLPNRWQEVIKGF